MGSGRSESEPFGGGQRARPELRSRYAAFWESGPQFVKGPDLQAVGFRHLQEHSDYRAPGDAAARGILQHPEPPELFKPVASEFHRRCRTTGYCTNGISNGFYNLTATGDVGIGNPFLGGGAPRGIQLAAKFTF